MTHHVVTRGWSRKRRLTVSSDTEPGNKNLTPKRVFIHLNRNDEHQKDKILPKKVKADNLTECDLANSVFDTDFDEIVEEVIASRQKKMLKSLYSKKYFYWHTKCPGSGTKPKQRNSTTCKIEKRAS